MKLLNCKVRIGIFHLSLNSCGGAELTTLMLGKAIHERGYCVDLFTITKTNWPKITRTFGIGKSVFDSEHVVPPFRSLPTLYARCIYWLLRDMIALPLVRSKFDLTITTSPTFPIVFSDIVYIQFPDISPDYLDEVYTKYSSGLLRAYVLPLRALGVLFVRIFRSLNRRPIVIANSKYTQGKIKRILNIDPYVVYPPIAIAKRPRSSVNNGRENIVLTISRLEAAKNLRVLPRLATMVSNANFIVVGSTYRDSAEYISSIIQEAEQRGVDQRLEFRPNCDDAEKQNLLSRAKVYLHTMIGEPFGISVIEGMSNGLVPLVPRGGGPWIDILEKTQGLWGYAYGTVEEAALIVEKILSNEKLRRQMSRRALVRAAKFHTEHFERDMLSILERVVESKCINS